VLSLGALLVSAIAVGQRGEAAQQGGAPAQDPAARALDGAVDIHVHSYPDDRERSLDGIEATLFARAQGMRGLVLKNHYDPTGGLAFLARKQVPGIEVFGGIDLNLPVGGMNPHAVEHMTRVRGGWGRVVWMSTFDAENQVRYSKENRPFVSVSRGGELLPATRDVIAVIAKHKLTLATGHVSAEEALMLVREARRQGVEHIVLTHAMNAPILMSVPQMQEAAKMGAFIEFCGSTMLDAGAKARVDRYADAIRKIGPHSVILSSDLGQKGNPLPTNGFAAYILALGAKGFTEQELDRMAKQNPARLLGLSDRKS
jgi:hypothetical protein